MNSIHQFQEAEYDVAVVGGGIAGISAALAASRFGAKTILLEKEYALGGLATLGLIIVYLPLCDGKGVQMSGGIAEELLKLSCGLSSVKLPPAWADPNSTVEERIAGKRYMVEYNAASFMILAERLLTQNNVTILYDARMTDAEVQNGKVTAVTVPTKTGSLRIKAKAFVDASGDCDLCYFAGEETFTSKQNRRTGWYFSNGKDGVRLVQQTDPHNINNLYDPPPTGSRYYDGTNIYDISQHMIDMRKMIADNVEAKQSKLDPTLYPIMIPTFHGLRMTRRLVAEAAFSDKNDYVWFDDAIGMIGNWKSDGHRYAVPYSTIKAVKNSNLFAAGRNTAADDTGWDLTRVIPTCAVTGQAAGAAAAMLAENGTSPNIKDLQNYLVSTGVLLDRALFN